MSGEEEVRCARAFWIPIPRFLRVLRRTPSRTGSEASSTTARVAAFTASSIGENDIPSIAESNSEFVMAEVRLEDELDDSAEESVIPG